MARLTLYFCDLCKEPKTTELGYTILISKKGKATRGNSKATNGDICEECFTALSATIEQEIEPTLPQAGRQSTRREKVKAPALPLSNDNEDGFSVIPSNLTDARRRELNKEDSDKCRHSTGFTMEDGSPHCKDCGERVVI